MKKTLIPLFLVVIQSALMAQSEPFIAQEHGEFKLTKGIATIEAFLADQKIFLEEDLLVAIDAAKKDKSENSIYFFNELLNAKIYNYPFNSSMLYTPDHKDIEINSITPKQKSYIIANKLLKAHDQTTLLLAQNSIERYCINALKNTVRNTSLVHHYIYTVEKLIVSMEASHNPFNKNDLANKIFDLQKPYLEAALDTLSWIRDSLTSSNSTSY